MMGWILVAGLFCSGSLLLRDLSFTLAHMLALLALVVGGVVLGLLLADRAETIP